MDLETRTEAVAPTTALDALRALRSFVRRSLKHAPAGVAVALVGAALTAGFVATSKHIYVSETVLLYRRIIRPSYLGRSETEAPEVSQDVGLRLRELLLARPPLEHIVARFKLYPRVVEERGAIEAVDRMREAIDYRVGSGDTFHIAFRGNSPEIAEQVTKALAESLIEEDLQLRTDQVSATVRFLETETERVQGELQKYELSLAKFLAEHPEFAQEQLSGPSGSSSPAGASIRAAQARERTRKRGDMTGLALKRQADRIRSQLEQGQRGEVSVPADPSLSAAKEAAEEDLREAQSELAQREAQFTDAHPDVISTRKRVALSKARVARVAEALRASTQAGRTVTSVDRSTLQRELATIEGQMAHRPTGAAGITERAQESKADFIVALETEWNQLNRQVREVRERYLRLESRQFGASLEASSELTGNASQIRVIDPAYRPTKPAGVRRAFLLASGMGLSCLLAALLMCLLGSLDDRVYDRGDVERLRTTRVLVTVNKTAPNTVHRKGAARGVAAARRSEEKRGEAT